MGGNFEMIVREKGKKGSTQTIKENTWLQGKINAYRTGMEKHLKGALTEEKQKGE